MQISEFFHRMQWKDLSVFSERNPSRLFNSVIPKLFKLATDSKIRLVQDVGSSPRNEDGLQKENMVVFAGDEVSEDFWSLLMRSSAFTILLVTGEEWNPTFKVPMGLYHLRAGGRVTRIVTGRARPGEIGPAFQRNEELSPLGDFGGVRLQAVTLTYPPFLTLHSCPEHGEPCTEASGLCLDVLEFLARDANFTFDIYEEPSRDWGILPGRNWTAADTEGVIRGVLNGSNDLPLSSWEMNPIRFCILKSQTCVLQLPSASSNCFFNNKTGKFMFSHLI